MHRLGLDRPELRAWAMYDWAISGLVTIVTAVFPIYFARVAAADIAPEIATFRYGIATTVGLALVAIVAPILGAMADYAAIKKRMLGIFMGVGAAAAALMFLIQRGDWLLASILFILVNLGASGSYVFYDAFLPHVARDEEMDRVSTTGYALGYLGGGLLLAFNLAWIQKPEWFGLPYGPGLTEAQATLPTRLAFLSVAIWWAGFSIPFFRNVSEPVPKLETDEERDENPIKIAIVRLIETLRELRQFRNAFLMLLAFLIYNDGIQTIIRMAAIYGTEIGIGQGPLIASILLVQFVGIPFAFLFGTLAGRIGAKRSIFLGLTVYGGISVLGYFMTSALHFLLLAILVGTVQGGTQALSRSLFASMIPRYKSGEFFGFFAVMEKFAGIFGPTIFSLVLILTGSSRNGILSVIGFFAVGGIILALVDTDEGKRIARAAEATARESGARAAG